MRTAFSGRLLPTSHQSLIPRRTMSLFCRSMSGRVGLIVSGLCLAPLLTACGVVQHRMAEGMTDSNRRELLQGLTDEQLCRGYNNQLVGEQTERQILELLRSRGVAQCVALGRTRTVTATSTSQPTVTASLAAAATPVSPEDAAAVERERLRVGEEAKKREADRVAAEARAAAESKEREDSKAREAAAAKSHNEASKRANEERKRSALRSANANERAQISREVKEGLLDPDSAKFGDIYVVPKENACAAVNGKNRFGGYVGFKSAMLAYIGGDWKTLMTLDISMLECLSVITKLDK